MGATGAPSPSRSLAAAAAIVAVAILAYSNTLEAAFHLDDFRTIVGNPAVRDLAGFWPPSGERWLGMLTFALNYRLGGLDVRGFHAVNLAIHACNGLLVSWLAALALRTPALRSAGTGTLLRAWLPLTAGLLFVAHPLATQAVTYVVQRFTSLATLLFLVSIASWTRARLALEEDRPARGRAAALFALSVLAAVGAMKTKPIAFTLPAVAFGLDLLLFRPGRGRLLLLPLATTALLVPLGRAEWGAGPGDLLGTLDRAATETPDLPRSVYLLTEARVVVTYLRLLVLPRGQSVDHDFALSHRVTEPAVLGSFGLLLGVAALAVALLVRARRTGRAAGVLVFLGAAWFFVTLSVESSVIPIRDVIFEHRTYLPGVGAAIALATGLLGGVERLRLRAAPSRTAAVALSVVVLPLGAATYARNLVWRDAVTLWTDAVSKSPGKARPHANLGVAYAERGRMDDAIRELRAAIRIDPGFAKAQVSLGAAYGTLRRYDDAIAHLRAALVLDPGLAMAHVDLGAAYEGTLRVADAIREYREAIRLDPALALAHRNLGAALRATGRLDEAIAALREAVRLEPGAWQARLELARAYDARGLAEDALRERRTAEASRRAPGAVHLAW